MQTRKYLSQKLENKNLNVSLNSVFRCEPNAFSYYYFNKQYASIADKNNQFTTCFSHTAVLRTKFPFVLLIFNWNIENFRAENPTQMRNKRKTNRFSALVKSLLDKRHGKLGFGSKVEMFWNEVRAYAFAVTNNDSVYTLEPHKSNHNKLLSLNNDNIYPKSIEYSFHCCFSTENRLPTQNLTTNIFDESKPTTATLLNG